MWGRVSAAHLKLCPTSDSSGMNTHPGERIGASVSPSGPSVEEFRGIQGLLPLHREGRRVALRRTGTRHEKAPP